MLEAIEKQQTLLDDQIEQQKAIAIDQDPLFREYELVLRFKNLEQAFSKVANIAKPVDKKKKKLPKNIKIDNMTFDGNSGMNWEDFIHVAGNDDDDEEPSF